MIAIRLEFTDGRIVMLTTFKQDIEIQRALEAGAYGYFLKTMPPQDPVETISLVHFGRKRVPADVAANVAEHFSEEALTERELDVLHHIASGNRNRDIAKRLLIVEETVHIKHIMAKLGASDRTEAPAIAVQRAIIRCAIIRLQTYHYRVIGSIDLTVAKRHSFG